MNRHQYKITRRQLVERAVSVGVGLMAAPFSFVKASETRMVARIFFDSYGTMALRQALRFAGDDGFVASLPQLLHARTNASYDNRIWNTWFTANSEESVVTTPQGNHVVITVHGGGIYGDPARIERTLRADLNRHNAEGLTGQYASKITEHEARDLLHGRLPDGTEFPVYTYDDFKRGVPELPARYGVVLDFETAKKAKNGYDSFEVLRDEPLMIIRAGGVEPLAVYIDKKRNRNMTEAMGNQHRFHAIDPAQPQTRILKLGGARGGKNSDGSDLGRGRGYDIAWGISAGGLIDLARYVAVSPRDPSTSVQFLDFEL